MSILEQKLEDDMKAYKSVTPPVLQNNRFRCSTFPFFCETDSLFHGGRGGHDVRL